MFIVGLTGGIGSGKSVVGHLFRDLGIKVVDADQGSREVVKPGMPALVRIGTHFGAHFLLPDGTLDRAALRDKIFSDAEAKSWLEALLHPLIRAWIKQELDSASSPYAILESPLLLEMGQHRDVDRVLVIDVPEEIQVERASARDNSDPAQIRAIIQAQISREQRTALADDVLDNTCPLDELPARVVQLHQQYLTMAR